MKVWTAAELAALTPEEDQRLFDESVITDLSKVPPAYLQRVRAKFLAQLAEQDSTEQDSTEQDSTEQDSTEQA